MSGEAGTPSPGTAVEATAAEPQIVAVDPETTPWGRRLKRISRIVMAPWLALIWWTLGLDILLIVVAVVFGPALLKFLPGADREGRRKDPKVLVRILEDGGVPTLDDAGRPLSPTELRLRIEAARDHLEDGLLLEDRRQYQFTALGAVLVTLVLLVAGAEMELYLTLLGILFAAGLVVGGVMSWERMKVLRAEALLDGQLKGLETGAGNE